jgi:hypothetical protein
MGFGSPVTSAFQGEFKKSQPCAGNRQHYLKRHLRAWTCTAQGRLDPGPEDLVDRIHDVLVGRSARLT